LYRITQDISHKPEEQGAAEVAALTNTVPSTANISFYENEVLTAYRGRAAWRAAVTAKEALENREAPDAVLTKLAAELEAVTRSGASAGGGILFRDLLEKQLPPGCRC
jgi:replicative DNA helicase